MIKRLRIEIEGIVQGVGFRPYVYRLATTRQLAGWVRNTPQGVLIEVEGPLQSLRDFRAVLDLEAPPLAVITAQHSRELPPCGERQFAIVESGAGTATAHVAPDADVCPDCLRELLDPADRRYRYPFINCTNCGPRYSIITAVPYDRPATTMATFAMCAACQREYEDPADRRFHAQPNACPACGPRLRLLDGQGREIAGDPLAQGVRLLREGQILAIKGIGGYHLAVDAGNAAAVAELRRRKLRDEKPFAVMAADLERIKAFAEPTEMEERLLTGPERPIVLVKKRARGSGLGAGKDLIVPQVAPANGYYGVMLPATPLHHLLLGDGFSALVMTSANVSDEPIQYRDEEALAALGGIVDGVLTHDRAIRTREDDPVIRVFRGAPLFLRRSRGYVPRGVQLPTAQRSVLAVGGELKSVACLTRGDRAFLTQHAGDLKNAATFAAQAEIITHLQRLLAIEPAVVAHDLHPDYHSTLHAAGIAGLPKVVVQHHHAHLASCMTEHRLEGEVLGVIFDGMGYGLDGTAWGGEFLLGDYRSFRRVAHIRPVMMPGGDAAAREPFRMAIAWLWEGYGTRVFDLPLDCFRHLGGQERKLFLQMLERRVNSPLTSSCGRLFDAVAALLGLRSHASYEGQAAIELEGVAEQGDVREPYPFALIPDKAGRQLDLRPLISAIVAELLAEVPRPDIAATFHRSLALGVAATCRAIRKEHGCGRIALSGGVFQNRLLTEWVATSLEQDGFTVFTHRLVPPNDGGLALGQAVIAGRSHLCA